MAIRRTRLKRRNAARIQKLRAKQEGPQTALCRALPCCACGAPPPSDPHHVRSRGAGGLDCDTVPLCRLCHGQIHTTALIGVKGGWVYPSVLKVVAAGLARRSGAVR